MAIILSLLLFAFLSIVSYEAFGNSTFGWLVSQAISTVLSVTAYERLSRRYRRRIALRKAPFPVEWERILQEYVEFYNTLSEEEKERFRYKVQVFLAETRITGIKTTIDDTDRLLVASSAIIPVFNFQDWTYTNLSEVLLYPGTFSENFSIKGKDRAVLGMVGSGYMNGMMILSQPELRNGFSNDADKHNVGIHEFVHLLDKTDGIVDGMPAALTDKQYALPWLQMMHNEIAQIKKGKSDIDAYGATSEQEFLAVASEYFFERPDLFEEKHPELYKMLTRVFRQDNSNRFKKLLARAGLVRRKHIGRNDPCPCGSGLKFKKCCGAA